MPRPGGLSGRAPASPPHVTVMGFRSGGAQAPSGVGRCQTASAACRSLLARELAASGSRGSSSDETLWERDGPGSSDGDEPFSSDDGSDDDSPRPHGLCVRASGAPRPRGLRVPPPRDPAHHAMMVYARAIINAKLWAAHAAA